MADPAPDPDDPIPDADEPLVEGIAVRAPVAVAVPITLDELAARKKEALEIIDTRDLVDDMLRAMAIRKSHPTDWVLNRAPEQHGGQVVGYLQDSGAARARTVGGVELFDIGEPQKVSAADGSFAYVVRGSGRTRFGALVRDVEAFATSDDEFCRGKAGIELDLAVRKAARTRLDGRITRKLLGLDAMPANELERAWRGTDKRLDQCRRGHGFGSGSERLGGTNEREPDVEPPTCPHCGSKTKYRPDRGRGAFYGCPNYQKHPEKKFTKNAAEWIASQHAPQAAAPTPDASGMPSAADVFGPREPGAEG